MPRFAPLTAETAVGASRDLLGELVERHGTVGDMVSTMAHSPAVLGGYLQLSRAMRRAKLDRRISELLSIAVQAQQGCGLCLDAHVAAARSLGVAEEEISLAHQGTSSNPAISAMIRLGRQVYRGADLRHRRADRPAPRVRLQRPRDRRRRRRRRAQHPHRRVQPRRRAGTRGPALTPEGILFGDPTVHGAFRPAGAGRVVGLAPAGLAAGAVLAAVALASARAGSGGQLPGRIGMSPVFAEYLSGATACSAALWGHRIERKAGRQCSVS